VRKGAGPQAIHDRIRQEHPEFNGSVSAVKRLCRSIRRARGVRPEDVAIPLETEPGQEAQVDFGYVGQLYDPVEGRLRKAYVFVMVLSHSRHQFVRICFDQKVETWLLLHMGAFEHFGGVPAVVVPDNLKSAVIRAAFTPSEPTTLNRSYRELAGLKWLASTCGFDRVLPCGAAMPARRGGRPLHPIYPPGDGAGEPLMRSRSTSRRARAKASIEPATSRRVHPNSLLLGSL
jgi:hypothetical protein